MLKKNINLVIGQGLRGQKERSAGYLIGASFLIGVMVSLLEAVCTGQVYLPTIVFITKNQITSVKAWVYLLVYNLMFILPLVVIFVMTLVGFGSQKFNDLLKRHLGRIKVLMVVLFLILGILMLWIV